MIDHVWSVLCNRAIIDAESKNMSIHDVVEQLQITEAPKPGGVLPIRVELVTYWVRSIPDRPMKGLSRVSYIFPSGKVAGQIEVPVDLTEVEGARNKVVFERLPVEENGRHYYLVELKDSDREEWTIVAKIPLRVSFSALENDDEENRKAEPIVAEA
jgi:hypothetical protein